MTSVAIIFEGKNNTILLQLRDEKAPTYPGMWGLFGGAIEAGEKAIQAAVREVREELGINLREGDLVLLLEINSGNDNFHVFKSKFPWNLKDIKLDEGQDMKFFSREEISQLNNLVPLLKQFGDAYWKTLT